jgi:tRNA modification GTPase
VSGTIVAPATPPGRSALAVIRLSGPGTLAALERVGVRVGAPRTAVLRTLAGSEGEALDRGLVLWFPAPHSYTGEDCAELHLHGGRYVVQAVLDGLLTAGARLAEPGEFTRRAFENGKLDLSQAEAVADLIDAETSAQARQALGQLGGALSRRHERWRGALVEILARLEAAVDFPDEDIDPALGQAAARLAALHADLTAAAADATRGEGIRNGWRVAIIGAPNAGKSTLLNALAGRDAAIVTDVAGTTRDVIEVPLDIGGYRVLLADMAGLRETGDAIEREGVRRARAWAEGADTRLWVVDGSADEGWQAGQDLVGPGDLCVVSKADLPAGAATARISSFAGSNTCISVVVNLHSGGAKSVRAWLENRLSEALGSAEFPSVTRARHLQALAQAAAHMARALEVIKTPELAAEDVRLAARALARITGKVGAEDVLDAVFATFCIGK